MFVLRPKIQKGNDLPIVLNSAGLLSADDLIHTSEIDLFFYRNLVCYIFTVSIKSSVHLIL